MINIEVIDAPMGAGKTSWAIQYMNENNRDYFEGENFFFVTPFLSEVDRITKSCKNFYAPEGEKKQQNLAELVNINTSIATTHQMLHRLTPQTIETIAIQDYHLILDEVLTVVTQEDISEKDLKALLELKILKKDDNGKIVKGDEKTINEYYDNEDDTNFAYYNIIIGLKRKILDVFEGKFFFFLFPIDILQAFSKITILTYMFDGYPIKGYLDLHGIKYNKKSVVKKDDKYELVDYIEEDGSKYKNLINIIEGNINDIGNRDNAFSLSWLHNINSDTTDKIRRNTINFVKNKTQSRVGEILWTTFKESAIKLSNDKLKYGTKSDNFVPHNIRATNDYIHTKNCIYLCNRFFNPIVKRWLTDKNIEVNEDVYALSEFLQWLFRSQIREGKPINVYVPSKRIRNLFKKWLK